MELVVSWHWINEKLSDQRFYESIDAQGFRREKKVSRVGGYINISSDSDFFFDGTSVGTLVTSSCLILFHLLYIDQPAC